MDSLSVFIHDTYIIKPDSRLPVKDIYEDFRAWVIGKQGAPAWNNISQKQVYTALKQLPFYAYVRYREGYCLKGIAYKLKEEPNPLILNIIPTEVPKIEEHEKQLKLRVDPPRIAQIVMPRAFQTTS